MTSLKPTAYDWPVVQEIPQREFLCGPAYQRGQISLTIGPGGLGKSTLCLTEAVAMAGGFSVFGNEPMNLKVWYLSAEDDKDEIDRRIAAACEALHAERSSNLHVDCVERDQIQIANSDGLNTDLIENLIAEMHIVTDLQKRASMVVTSYDERVPLSKATLDAITAVARGPAGKDREKHETCEGRVALEQVMGPASVHAATYPERRRRAMAQIEAAAAHLTAIGRKGPAKALLKQARATWGEEG